MALDFAVGLPAGGRAADGDRGAERPVAPDPAGFVATGCREGAEDAAWPRGMAAPGSAATRAAASAGAAAAGRCVNDASAASAIRSGTTR